MPTRHNVVMRTRSVHRYLRQKTPDFRNRATLVITRQLFVRNRRVFSTPLKGRKKHQFIPRPKDMIQGAVTAVYHGDHFGIQRHLKFFQNECHGGVIRDCQCSPGRQVSSKLFQCCIPLNVDDHPSSPSLILSLCVMNRVYHI